MNILEKYRKEIDECDKDLLKILKKRMDVSRKIGNYKKKKGLKVFDSTREKIIIKRANKKSSLDKKFVGKLYKLIFRYSKKLQH